MVKQHKDGNIPVLNIYGVESAWPDPAGLHIEDIEARAAALDYVVKPHAHRDMFQIAIALSGACDLSLDGETRRLEHPGIVSIPGGVVHGFNFEPPAKGWVLTVAHDLVLSARSPGDAKVFAPLLREPHVLEFADRPERMPVYAAIMTLMLDEFAGERLARGACLEALLSTALIHLRRDIEYSAHYLQYADRDRKLFHDFRALVEHNFTEGWSVRDYARALKCSQPRLNKVSNIFAGAGANGVILDRVTTEAKRRLIYTTAPAAMIAYALGFADPSYFSRFFKRQTGQTPAAFRQEYVG